MAFVAEQPEDISKWRMVDHERNAILVKGSTIGRSPQRYFSLIWEGQEIVFSAIYKIDGIRSDGQSKMQWDILTCTIPEELKDRSREVRQLIIDAMKDYGFSYGKKDGLYAIDVFVSPSIGNLNLPTLN